MNMCYYLIVGYHGVPLVSKDHSVITNKTGLKRTLSASLMVCVAAVSLSACGGTSDKDNAANIKELKARGFTNPLKVNGSDGVGAGYVAYDVGFGSCRIQVQAGNTLWGWNYMGYKDIDATRLKTVANKVGLKSCLSSTTATSSTP